VAKLKAQDFIKGIKNRDNDILKILYKQHFPLIRAFILNNNGTVDDAKDIFQEALIVIYRYARKDNFEINCAFETFLYSICRTIWLNKLRNKRIHYKKLDDIIESVTFSSSDNEQIEDNLRYKLYQKHFQKLDKSCKKLLQLFYDKVPYKEIAKQMGYRSIGFVKKKKFKCKEYLMKSIKNDPEFKLLTEKRQDD
jgi:RNA polymerase sigma factor (sigma-70 family)